MFNNKISAAGKIYCFSKRPFYLFGNTKLIENGETIYMMRNNFLSPRSNFLNVGDCIVINILIVSNNTVEILCKQISQDACGLILFTQYFCRCCSILQIFLDCFPCINEILQILMQFSSILA